MIIKKIELLKYLIIIKIILMERNNTYQKKILIIEHHNETEIGIIDEFCKKNNILIDIIKPLKLNIISDKFLNTNEYQGVIILGGAMNVSDTDQYPGLINEMSLIEKILKSNIPTLGICLGAQLIANIFGAEVDWHKDEMVEIGYKKVKQERNNNFFNDFPKYVYHWHQQGFTLPRNSKRLATNNTFMNQAFMINDMIFGFQFHPEINEMMIKNWCNKNSKLITKLGASSCKEQLEDHKRYSANVKKWFENFLKNWLMKE